MPIVNPARAIYATMFRIAAALLLIAAPVMADPSPHSGIAGSRSMPELSDIALAVCAAGGVWAARRALRARFRRAPKD